MIKLFYFTLKDKSPSYSNPDPKKIDFKNVFRINEFLKYGIDEPLWYIFHPIAKSSFGPCSTENLEEMYNGNMVDGQSEVRFIDIFNISNKKPFSFFKLKEMDEKNFIDEIEISSLIKKTFTLEKKNFKQKSENFESSNSNSSFNQQNNSVKSLNDFSDKGYNKNINRNDQNKNDNKKSKIIFNFRSK